MYKGQMLTALAKATNR